MSSLEKWLRGEDILDSLILSRMKDENKERGGNKLETLLCTEFNALPWKGETEKILKKEKKASALTRKQRMDRCRIDAWATAVLAEKLEQDVDDPELIEFTHRTQMSLHRMGLAGAAVSLPIFNRLGKEWKLEAEKHRDKFTRFALRNGMKEYVPTNDNQTRELLYQKLKLPILRRTDTDDLPSVDKTTLKELLAKGTKQIDDLIKFNEADKLCTGWYGNAKTKKPSVSDLLQLFPKGGSKALLHFIINPLGTKTGRRSSGGDFDEDKTVDARNSQNWPAVARAMIVSRWKEGKIGCVDYSSLEPIIQSWIARDDLLFDIFYNGNGYFDIARELFGYTVTSKEDRIYKLTKNTYLGVAYLMGKWLMAQYFWNNLGIRLSADYKTHENEVDKIRLKLLRTFKGLSAYQDKQRSFVARHQYVTSPSGRIRHLPHNGTGERGYKRVENQAVNFPVQSFASDITASAIIDFEEALLKEHRLSYTDWHYALLTNPFDPPCSVLFNEVHDEADMDLHPRYGKRDLEILEDAVINVRSIKELVPDFDIDLKNKITVGRSWK